MLFVVTFENIFQMHSTSSHNTQYSNLMVKRFDFSNFITFSAFFNVWRKMLKTKLIFSSIDFSDINDSCVSIFSDLKKSRNLSEK